jgi:acetate kinase
MRIVAKRFPGMPQVACFDTAFHADQPEVVRTYALPRAISERGIRRYGFHGLSYEYVSKALRHIAPTIAAGRVVVAHLGSGASLCAMRDGRSFASTMGYTAMGGLPMGTRCGDLDPGVVLYMMNHLGMSGVAVERMLYNESGLLGMSGISSDMRALLASEDPRAKLAVDVFVHRVGRELGSLAAALGGLDALVFTAGIGERSAAIRARVCRDAAWLGVAIDDAANEIGARCISKPSSAVSVWVIPTDEERVIARQTCSVVAAKLESAT